MMCTCETFEDMPTPGAVTVGSLFAGIGGIDLAFAQAGADIFWANEIDHHACETYRLNSGADLTEGDVRDFHPYHTEIVTAGFPCQPFSIAGLRRGFDDPRGTMFFEVLRVIRETQPRAILLENVPQLASHDGAGTFKVIMESLEGEGYELRVTIRDNIREGGLPQHRPRLFIVGFKTDDPEVCPEIDRFCFPGPVPMAPIESVLDLSAKQDGRYYYGPDSAMYSALDSALKDPGEVCQWRRTYVRSNKCGVCPCLTANMGTGGHNVPIIRDSHGIRKLTPDECLRLQGFPEEFRFPDGLADCHRYKQAGNSVSVPVVRRIAERMMDAMRYADASRRSGLI